MIDLLQKNISHRQQIQNAIEMLRFGVEIAVGKVFGKIEPFLMTSVKGNSK